VVCISELLSALVAKALIPSIGTVAVEIIRDSYVEASGLSALAIRLA
jgi:hypothetical protein